MAPVSMGVSTSLGASVDPFLMAVAIGGSSAFLTPIGHQSNTIVMGPGGYRFGDYWRMGLPLEVLIVAISVPLIMWAWPLGIRLQSPASRGESSPSADIMALCTSSTASGPISSAASSALFATVSCASASEIPSMVDSSDTLSSAPRAALNRLPPTSCAP
ncbi:MAG: anion permease [Dehalococcoidia bacterium]|nr:anion permease [Dehalococcoidia bacterium]